MPEQRRRFGAQFKAEAVQMLIETGKPIAGVARDLGIHDGTLGNWVNAYRRAHPEPDQPLTPVDRAHVKELETRWSVVISMTTRCSPSAAVSSSSDRVAR
jgi:transposase-like protein